MLGTTVDGVSIDTPSTLLSVSDSGGLRGNGNSALPPPPPTDVEVTTGGSMRWVILAIGAVADGEAGGASVSAAVATTSSLCCISQIFKWDRRAKSSSSF